MPSDFTLVIFVYGLNPNGFRNSTPNSSLPTSTSPSYPTTFKVFRGIGGKVFPVHVHSNGAVVSVSLR